MISKWLVSVQERFKAMPTLTLDCRYKRVYTKYVFMSSRKSQKKFQGKVAHLQNTLLPG